MSVQPPTIGWCRPRTRLRFWLHLVLLAGCSAMVACTTSTAVESDPPHRPAEVATGEASAPIPGPDPAAPGCRVELIGIDPARALELAVVDLGRVVTELRETAPGETALTETTRDEPGLGDCAVTRQPLCAALYLLAATDPILGWIDGAGRDELTRLVTLHTTVLDHATTLAGRSEHAGLSSALDQLAALELSVGELGDDNAIVAVLTARAAPDIVEPIAAVEADC